VTGTDADRCLAAVDPLSAIEQCISALERADDVVICGITGADASGKTHLSRQLAERLRRRFAVTIIHVDDFHNPKTIRYAGVDSAESYLTRSINFPRLIDEVLRPLRADRSLDYDGSVLDLASDAFVKRVRYKVEPGDVVILEGVFLARPELHRYLHLLVQLTAEEAVLRARGIARDRPHLGAAAEERYDRKYLAAQRLFSSAHQPGAIADIVVDTSSLERPRVLAARTPGPREFPFRHAIFDFNGTLADTKAMIAATRSAHVRRLAALTGAPLETVLAECRAFLGADTMNSDIAAHLPSVRRWCGEDTQRRARLAGEIETFRADVVAAAAPPAGSLRALMLLRRAGTAISVWTDSRASHIDDLLHLFGFAPLVDRVFCRARTDGVGTPRDCASRGDDRLIELAETLRKPSSAALRAIVHAAKIPGRDTILVGNSLVGDGLSCVGTDVRFVLTTWGEPDAETIEALDALNGVEKRKATEKETALHAHGSAVAVWRTASASLLDFVLSETNA